jgi:hypothetical protein
MRKRATIADGVRERHSSGQCDYSSHSCPADHKHLTNSGLPFILVKQARADDVSDIGAGKRSEDAQQDKEGAKQMPYKMRRRGDDAHAWEYGRKLQAN